ncbi:hypothetical protein ACH419_30630 [Streptomyces bobili]|uniref:hypothetical protein n=1 Tax=Streptomyces bobili TaxID=67280 RepID=UPI0037AE2084
MSAGEGSADTSITRCRLHRSNSARRARSWAWTAHRPCSRACAHDRRTQSHTPTSVHRRPRRRPLQHPGLLVHGRLTADRVQRRADRHARHRRRRRLPVRGQLLLGPFQHLRPAGHGLPRLRAELVAREPRPEQLPYLGVVLAWRAVQS